MLVCLIKNVWIHSLQKVRFLVAMYDQYKEQSEEVTAYEEVKAQLEQQIKQQKSQEELGKLVQKLREDSEIEVLI